MSTEDLEPLLTVKEAAALFKRHERTIRNWIKRGDLVAVDTSDDLLIEPEAIRRYIRSRRTSPLPGEEPEGT